MGTMFSILLPMKRISEDILNKVAANPECRRYSVPAITQRVIHDKERATPNTSPKITPLSSPRATPRNSVVISDPVKWLEANGTTTSFATEFPPTKNTSLLLSNIPLDSSKNNDSSTQLSLNGVCHSFRTAELAAQCLLPPQSTTSPSPEEESSRSRRTSVVDDIHNALPPTSSSSTVKCVSNGANGENTKYHILVVDDSPLNRKMLSKLLKSKGHRLLPPLFLLLII
jgi:CheY-like chemotaxis protein